MAGTDKDTGPEDRDAARFAEQLRASAQQVWLAGVGAFARAQEEGGKLFDALVREGAALQGRMPEAGDRVAQAASRMADMASEFSAKAGDRLEGMFDKRVARAVDSLGVASAKEVEQLAARVEELERTLARLSAKAAAPRRRAARTEPKPAAPRSRPRDGG